MRLSAAVLGAAAGRAAVVVPGTVFMLARQPAGSCVPPPTHTSPGGRLLISSSRTYLLPLQARRGPVRGCMVLPRCRWTLPTTRPTCASLLARRR